MAQNLILASKSRLNRRYIRLMILVLLAALSLPALGAQTLGLASVAWLPEGCSQSDMVLAQKVISDVETGILDLFFENGYIGFNLPVRCIPDVKDSLQRKNLEFINLGDAMDKGGAQAGLLAEVWIGFSRNPDRAFVQDMRLSSLRLRTGSGTGGVDLSPLARSMNLSVLPQGDMNALMSHVAQAFGKVISPD